MINNKLTNNKYLTISGLLLISDANKQKGIKRGGGEGDCGGGIVSANKAKCATIHGKK
jgi:hypothetical protein